MSIITTLLLLLVGLFSTNKLLRALEVGPAYVEVTLKEECVEVTESSGNY